MGDVGCAKLVGVRCTEAEAAATATAAAAAAAQACTTTARMTRMPTRMTRMPSTAFRFRLPASPSCLRPTTPFRFRCRLHPAVSDQPQGRDRLGGLELPPEQGALAPRPGRDRLRRSEQGARRHERRVPPAVLCRQRGTPGPRRGPRSGPRRKPPRVPPRVPACRATHARHRRARQRRLDLGPGRGRPHPGDPRACATSATLVVLGEADALVHAAVL